SCEEDSDQESASAQEFSERVKPLLFANRSSSAVSKSIADKFSSGGSKGCNSRDLDDTKIAFIQNDPDYYHQVGRRKERDEITSDTDYKDKEKRGKKTRRVGGQKPQDPTNQIDHDARSNVFYPGGG